MLRAMMLVTGLGLVGAAAAMAALGSPEREAAAPVRTAEEAPAAETAPGLAVAPDAEAAEVATADAVKVNRGLP